jgi:hypothetical protein
LLLPEGSNFNDVHITTAEVQNRQGGTGIPESAKRLNEDMPGKSLNGHRRILNKAVSSPLHLK